MNSLAAVSQLPLLDREYGALKGPQLMTGPRPFLASAAARLIGPSHWRTVAKGATALLVVGWIGYGVGVPVWTARAERPDVASAEKAKAADDAEARRKTEEAERQHLAALRAEEAERAGGESH